MWNVYCELLRLVSDWDFWELELVHSISGRTLLTLCAIQCVMLQVRLVINLANVLFFLFLQCT